MFRAIRKFFSEIEALITDAVAKIAPWAAPIPTAYLVGRATVEHLRWPPAVGVVAAVIVESLGLATTATALELREYNATRRKSDPIAPFALAAALVGIYFTVAVGLTVALDIAPALAIYAPAIFPSLSLVGMTVLALRADHRRRLALIEAVKLERKARRQMRRQARRQAAGVQVSKNSSNVASSNEFLNAARQAKREARLDALVEFYRTNPTAGPTEAGRAIGVSRQTIYVYNAELERLGRIRRNGNGWEVL